MRSAFHSQRAAAGVCAAGLLLGACANGNAERHVTRIISSAPTNASPTEGASASIDAAKQRAAQQHANDVAAGNEQSEPAIPDKGIFVSPEAPFATVDFRATGHWGGRVNGRNYAVYAGRDGQHASVGEVIVEPYGAGSRRRPRVSRHRLSGVGELRIVDEHGAILVLKDVQRTDHFFDVASGSFEDRCRAERLRLAVARGGSTMSQPFDDVSITNIGTQACVLTGYPQIKVAGQRAWPHQPAPTVPLAITVRHRIYERLDPGPHPILVRPQHRAFFSIGTADAYDGPLYTLTRLAVILPATRSAKVLAVALLANGPPGRRIPVGITAINHLPHA